jgi:methionyl aminopeptidase
MASPAYIVHTDDEIKGIREAAATTALVREQIALAARPGMSTARLDDIAGELIHATGGTSAFHGYRGFPARICISLNEKVVHGIGNLNEIMMPGDVVSIDVGVKLNGFIGDTAKSFIIGTTASDEIKRLLDKTEESLMAGIEAAVPGNYIRDISASVEKVASTAGLGIVREYVGHGCGVELHEPPEIPNFASRQRGPELVPGMVLAIEPMLNLGTHRVVTEPDQWTVRTYDRKPSAHFEHMVLITENKAEILTWRKM